MGSRPKYMPAPLRCKATSKTTGQQCGHWAKPGVEVCWKHGANAPHVKDAARRRVAERRIKGTLGRLKFTAVEDPYAELQNLAGEMVALKDKLRDKVEELAQIRYQSGDGEQLRAELAVYSQLLRDCSSTLIGLAKLALDERMVRIKEAQAEQIKKAIDGALRKAGLEGQPLTEARKEVARRLRVVS